MNYHPEFEKSYHAPVVAGAFRLLLGLAVMFAGLYLAVFSDMPGHGLGFLLILGSPFVIIKDER